VVLWHLADVLCWLDGRKGYEPDPVVRETAAARAVNITRETHRYLTDAPKDLNHLVV
jgi:hypothetical protein